MQWEGFSYRQNPDRQCSSVVTTKRLMIHANGAGVKHLNLRVVTILCGNMALNKKSAGRYARAFIKPDFPIVTTRAVFLLPPGH